MSALSVSAHGRVGARRWTGGLSVSGALSLAAVVAVLVVVAVPHLHGLGLQENEADARATAQLLARALGAPGEPRDLRALLARAGLGGLPDAELLEGDAILRRHGYLFAVGELPRGAGAAVRAWPWAHRDTGTAVFLVDASGTCRRHPNSPPRWEGLAAAGAPLDDLDGWQEIP